MKKYVIACFLLIFIINTKEAFSQLKYQGKQTQGQKPPEGHYYSLDSALKEPNKVKAFLFKPNTIHTIPKEITKFNNLTKLGLGGNKVSEIPPFIKELENLEELYASSNVLYSLPEEISELKNLKVLILSYNNIEKVPESICNLKSLELLDLRKNPLTKLPTCIHKCNNIREVRLYGTKIPKERQDFYKNLLPAANVSFNWE